MRATARSRVRSHGWMSPRSAEVNETLAHGIRVGSRARIAGGARERWPDRRPVGRLARATSAADRSGGQRPCAATVSGTTKGLVTCHDIGPSRPRRSCPPTAARLPGRGEGGPGRSEPGSVARASNGRRHGRAPHRCVGRGVLLGRRSVGATDPRPGRGGGDERGGPGACMGIRRRTRSLSLQGAVTCAGAHDPKPQDKVVRISRCSGCASGSDTSPADDPIRKRHQDL